MLMLSVLEVLHENPYTGDRIAKARVVHHLHNNDQQLPGATTAYTSAQQPQPTAEKATANGDTGLNSNAASEEATTRVSGLVAVKYLSDYRIVRPKHSMKTKSARCGWSSSSEDEISDSSSVGGRDSPQPMLPVEPPALVEQYAPRRVWPYIGHTSLPQGIRFGFKARREIRALKAAQGHPNIIPFLGFTGQPLVNPYRHTNKREQYATAAGIHAHEEQLSKLDATGVLESDTQGEPLPRPTLGGSLLQDDEEFVSPLFAPLPTHDAKPLAPPHTLESPPAFHYAHSDSSFESDDDSSFDEGSEEDPNALTPEAAARYWNRVFSRQPRVGGIILPYVPITMRDLICIGWTKTRPLLVETCMRQILEGLAWMHDEVGLIHRDISSGNILVAVESEASVAERGTVQCMISDFGCATFYRRKTESDQGSTMATDLSIDRGDGQNAHVRKDDDHGQAQTLGLTFEVGTRAYRAPELLFSSTNYTSAIDIWSAGVIFAEMCLGRTLFEADSDIGQICAIVKVLGTPSEENWPEYPSMPDSGKLVFKALEITPLPSILSNSDAGGEPTTQNPENGAKPGRVPATVIDMIDKMVVYSGAARPSAREALERNNRYHERTMVPSEHADEKVAIDESEDCKTGQDQQESHAHLDQCIIDVPRIMEEIQRLREREADEGEDDMGGFGGFGDAHESQSYRGFNDAQSEGGDAPWESGEEHDYRSDDLGGEDDQDEPTRSKPDKWTEPVLGDEYRDYGSARAVKRRRNSDDIEDEEETAHS